MWSLRQGEECSHLSHGVPGSSLLRRHLACSSRQLFSGCQVHKDRIPERQERREWVVFLTLAVAHTAQALPHFPCWLLEPCAEERAEMGSMLRRFITSASITWAWACKAGCRIVVRDCGLSQ